MALNHCKILKLKVRALIRGSRASSGKDIKDCTSVFDALSQNATEGQHPKIDLT